MDMTDSQKDLLKTFTEIGIAILSVVIPVLGARLKSKLLKKRKLLFEKTHNSQWSREVFELIVELRMRTRADRAWVLLRSNGTSYYNGLKGDHLTMIYESLEKGVTGILSRTQKVPVHFFEDSVAICDKQGFVKIVTEDLIETSFFRADLEDKGTLVFLAVPMRKCANSIPEGYVGVSYLVPPAVDDDIIVDRLTDTSSRVGLSLRVHK